MRFGDLDTHSMRAIEWKRMIGLAFVSIIDRWLPVFALFHPTKCPGRNVIACIFDDGH